jgi:hypothetical protein
VTIRATWRVCDNHRTPCEQPKTDDALLAVVLSGVLNLKRLPRKNEFSIGEIQSSFQQSLVSLGQIEGDTHLSYCKYKNIAQSGGNNFAGLAVLAIDASAFRRIQLAHKRHVRLSLPRSNPNRSF